MNQRIYEPLMLYALLSLNENQLSKFVMKNDKIKSDYETYFLDYKSFDNFDFFKLPTGYQKVFTSYESVKNQKLTEENLKKLMLNKIRDLQSEKNISTYRLYTDLKLNHGNVNDFIKNGSLNKLSLDSTRMILNYLL